MPAKTKLPKLNVWALGGAALIVWVFCVVSLGIAAAYGWGNTWVNLLSSVYIGYATTPLGILIGALWAAADAFIGGFLFAVLYNWILTWCPLIKK